MRLDYFLKFEILTEEDLQWANVFNIFLTENDEKSPPNFAVLI